VQADRVVPARALQHAERRTALGEEVLGMDLDEAERRPLVEHTLVVRLAQADADARAIGGQGGDEGLRRHACAAYFLVVIATWASSVVMPPSFLHVPLAT